MPKRIFLTLSIISIFILSCQGDDGRRSPIVLESWLINNQWRPQRLILGSDTQQVDSLFNKLAPYRYFGSTHVYALIKKYYISPEMQDILSNYILKNHKYHLTCDSTNLVSGDGYFYRFKAYDSRKRVVYRCMNDKLDAFIFYAGLENNLANSKFDNKQEKEILSDLRLLMVLHPFNPPPDEKIRIRKHLSENDWQLYLERKQKEELEIKEEIRRIVDSVGKK